MRQKAHEIMEHIQFSRLCFYKENVLQRNSGARPITGFLALDASDSCHFGFNSIQYTVFIRWSKLQGKVTGSPTEAFGDDERRGLLS